MYCIRMPFSLRFNPLKLIIQEVYECCLFYADLLDFGENEDAFYPSNNINHVIVDMQPLSTNNDLEEDKELEIIKKERQEKQDLEDKLNILLNDYDIVVDQD